MKAQEANSMLAKLLHHWFVNSLMSWHSSSLNHLFFNITDVPGMGTYHSSLRIMPHLSFKWFLFHLFLRRLILLYASLWTEELYSKKGKTVLHKYIPLLPCFWNISKKHTHDWAEQWETNNRSLPTDTVNTGATLPKTPVCILLCQLLSLQNCTSLRKRLQSRKIFPKGCLEGIWSSIVHQPQSRLRTLREHWAILMLNAHFVIAEEQSY